MKNGFQPDWSKEHAEQTFERLKGKCYRRPRGEKIYELVGVERLRDDLYGIRVVRNKRDKGYIVSHNTIIEENWTAL